MDFPLLRKERGRSARPAPAPRHAPARNPPQTVKQAPSPAPVQGGGIGFGTESAVAYRVVDVLMGPRTIQHEIVVSEAAAAALAPISSSMTGSDACSNHSKAFQDCVNHFGSDISKCQFYMDMLSECKKKSASGMLRA
ncbi:unnamed protein product [Prunus armeniaca]